MYNLSAKGFIKISTRVVRNEGLYIDNESFHLYVTLCRLYFLNNQNSELDINHKEVMRNLRISKNETFKKYINGLFKAGLIFDEVNNLPRRSTLPVRLNPEFLNDKPFTQLSLNIFNAYNELGISVDSFRLVFYYKSHINLHEHGRDRSFCFVGIRTLTDRLKIGNEKVIAANNDLKKKKIIKIEKHLLKHDHEYDEYDQMINSRFNNHYKIREQYL